MKIIPKTKEQILKDRLKTITKAEKAGLTYMGNSIYVINKLSSLRLNCVIDKMISYFRIIIKHRHELLRLFHGLNHFRRFRKIQTTPQVITYAAALGLRKNISLFD